MDELENDDALYIGKRIKDKDIITSFIISSTALRTKTTAELVSKGCKLKGDIIFHHSLYEAKPKGYLFILETVSDRYSRLLIAGHNTTIEEIIQILTGPSNILAIPSYALSPLSLPIEKWYDMGINYRKVNRDQNSFYGLIS